MQEFKDWLKRFDLLYYVTGFTIVIAFLAVVYTILFREVPAANEKLFIHLIGIIEAAFIGGLVGFFFTRSRTDKNDGTVK